MKKSLTILLSAAILVAATAAFLVSCKKDQLNLNANNPQDNYQSEAKHVFEKIKHFQAQRDSYHSNSKADNGTVSAEEARSILDASINYEFSDINRWLNDTELDTLRYEAPAADAQGNVAVNDIINLYDSFASDISEVANSVNYFMVVYPQGNSRNDDVEVVFTRGAGEPTPKPTPYPGPFEEEDNWIWGMDNGHCIYGGYSDAAQELTKRFMNTGARNNNVDTVNQYGYTVYDVEYATIGYNPAGYDSLLYLQNCSEYWLFYADSVPEEEVSTYCIPYEEMNCYWRSIRRNVVLTSGCFHYSPIFNSPYQIIEIKEKWDKKGNYMDISHSAEIQYFKIGYDR